MDAGNLTIAMTGLTALAMALIGYVVIGGAATRERKPVRVKARRRIR